MADPELLQVLDPAGDLDAVLVTLVGHDRQGHAVKRSVRWADEHALPSVLPCEKGGADAGIKTQKGGGRGLNARPKTKEELQNA